MRSLIKYPTILATTVLSVAAFTSVVRGAGDVRETRRDDAGFFARAADAGSAALQRASAAYLQRDFAAMTTELHELLSSPELDSVERQSALELLHQAYAQNGGSLPADWQVPDGIANLKFKELRREGAEDIGYGCVLSGGLIESNALKQVQVVGYPDHVILDRQKGIGEWTVEKENGGGFSFALRSDDQAQPMADGLYLISFEMQDGRQASGWFIVSDLLSTASPVLESPAVGETVTTSNPVLHWQDFHSPEYKPNERRFAGVSVGHPGGTWPTVWDLWEADPSRVSAVVGGESGWPQLILEDGAYYCTVSYQEQHVFGPIKLRRDSRTTRRFFVKTH